MVLILADSRENKGANPFLNAAIAENNKYYEKMPVAESGGDLSVEIKTLAIGDYAVLLDTGALALIIERKSWRDLAASIKDGRITEQGKNLEKIRVETNCIVLYLIEGIIAYKDVINVGGLPFRNLHAKVRHNLLRGYGYIHTKDEVHSAKVIIDLARDIARMKDELEFKIVDPEWLKYQAEIDAVHKRYAHLNQYKAYREITQIINVAPVQQTSIFPGMSGAQELSVPKILTTRPALDNDDLLMKMWQTLPGVSPKSAAILNSKYHIADLICGSITLQEIAALTYTTGKKFGENKAIKILDACYIGNDADILKRKADINVKILSCVSGCSKEMAAEILSKYSLVDICKKHVEASAISDIKKSNGRRIGKLADKICTVLVK